MVYYIVRKQVSCLTDHEYRHYITISFRLVEQPMTLVLTHDLYYICIHLHTDTYYVLGTSKHMKSSITDMLTWGKALLNNRH